MESIFDFTYFPALTTERLRLRLLTQNDADSIQTLFGSEEVLRFLSHPLITARQQAIDLINWFNQMFYQHEAVTWAITLRGEDRLIGLCGTHHWDRQDHHVDIGYNLLPSQWGKGYATEAARAVIGWSFASLDVHRVQADCTDGNIASERVLLKCGFTLEGIWRENCWEHERFVSIRQFGLLRREFEAD